MPPTPWDGHKPLHRGGQIGNGSGAAPGESTGHTLLQVPGVADVMGLLLQPSAEVLPAPADLVVCASLGDFDILVRLAHHNHHMVRLAVLILHQVAGSELLPVWAVDPPPWKITEGGIRTQRGPAGAMGSPVVGPAAGGTVGMG